LEGKNLIEFKITEHYFKPGVKIVVIYSEGKPIAAIYPAEEINGIKIVSAHFAEITKVDQPEEYPKVPYLSISFRPKRYTITEKGNIIIYCE
jgi:hypothetical protein